MADWSDLWTDETLEDLEKRLHRIYDEAQLELDIKAEEYFERYSERYLEEYAAYQEGKYTKKQFQEWVMSQIGRGKWWDKLRNDMAKRMTQSNAIAADYMNQTFSRIYSENYNYSAFIIEDYAEKYGDAYKIVDFTLLDENTVKRLSASKKLTMLPPKAKIDYTKDQEWNKRKIQNSLLQSILQGESIGQMASRLSTTVGHMNRVQAVRAARTMCTEAQSAGRQQSYIEAEELGIDMLKEWMSGSDDRVRESHAMLDGVRVPIKAYFPNGLEMPGDHRGAPEEVYNCRCTMRAVFPRYASGKNKRYSAVPGHEGYHDKKSYEEWKSSKTFYLPHTEDDYIWLMNSNKTESFELKHNKRQIKAKKWNGSSSGIYISNRLIIDDKTLKYIDDNISKSLKLAGADKSENRPRIVLTTTNDLIKKNGEVREGVYHAITNTVYITDRSFFEKYDEGFLMPESPYKIMLHELMHWDTAELFRSMYGEITESSYSEYREFTKEHAQFIISINTDIEIEKLSAYALDSMLSNTNEVATEIKTYLKLRS